MTIHYYKKAKFFDTHRSEDVRVSRATAGDIMAVYLIRCHLHVSAGARPAGIEALDSYPYSRRTTSRVSTRDKKKRTENRTLFPKSKQYKRNNKERSTRAHERVEPSLRKTGATNSARKRAGVSRRNETLSGRRARLWDAPTRVRASVRARSRGTRGRDQSRRGARRRPANRRRPVSPRPRDRGRAVHVLRV